MRNLLLLAVVLLVLAWVWGLRRAGRLFRLRIREGRVSSTSGRIPPRLLSEIADIVERAGVSRANITGVVRDGHPVLLFDGEMEPGAQQQMRNVVGQFTAGQIRGGAKR